MTPGHVRAYQPSDADSVACLEGAAEPPSVGSVSEVRGYVTPLRGRVAAALLGCEIPCPWMPQQRDFLVHGLYGDATRFRPLLDELWKDSCTQGWLVLRLQMPASFYQLHFLDGWEFSHLDVVRELDASDASAPAGYRTRDAGVHDAGLILAWTADAIEQGMTAQERRRFSAFVIHAARRRIQTILHGTWPLVVVAEDHEGRTIGHALADLVDSDWHGVCSHLHDVYVTPQHQGRGVAKYLSAVAQAKAREAGVCRMSATVCGTPAEHASLLRELGRQGWVSCRQTWIRVAT